MKKTLSITSVFLICLLALSTAPVTFGNYASATNSVGVANFLPNVSYYNYFDTEYESTLSLQTAQYITNELGKRYGAYPHYNYYKYGLTCKDTDYTNTLNAIKSNTDKAVVFSKGHRTIINVNGYTHYGLIPHPSNPGNSTSYLDYQIYPSTSTDNVVTFIWHCQTAMNYNGNGVVPKYPDNTYYGLPYCFTHNPSMQMYGSSGSQVYLGWNDKPGYKVTWVNGTIIQTGPNAPFPYNGSIGSPQYEWVINPTYKFCQVAGLYWYYMSQGRSTQDALNTLSKAIYGTGFYSSELNNWLVGFGNMEVGLPPTPPYYAKSATSSQTGNGYVNYPNNVLWVPDGSYAYLNSGSYGNKAEVTARFPTAPISGQLYVRCYTYSGNGANLKVYVGNQYGVWTQVVNTNLYTPTLVLNVNCGYVTNIDKVSIVAFHEYNGYPSNMYVDAVWVQ